MLAASTILWAALLLPLRWAPLAAQSAESALADWRRHGVCYEVFVRSFQDSDGNGVGDLRGLTAKLDYINDGDAATQRDLGAQCIWLMPVMPSPSYHGYDVTNYYEVNRDYGTLEDFRQLVSEAHRRGIHILVDLVANHMSSEHPFFRAALLDTASVYRDWFRWSPRVLPSPGWEAPVWHPVEGRDEFYYGLFWQGMPDINLADAAATAELKQVARFWLEEMDVDGFRFDAVRHFFEGPNGEWKNDPAVHGWLRDYSTFIRSVEPQAFTVGEVWEYIDSIVPYYPDQLDSYFIFEIADALVSAVRTGAGRGLLDAVTHAQRTFPAGRWSPFLRNHDQTRTMTELQGDVPRAKLAATLLLTLPGFPFVYYGEELGMTGDKPDRRLRTPMHWERGPAGGFTQGLPWEPLQPDSFTANVAVQQDDTTSLLNHYRRLIHLRATQPALAADGELIPLEAGNDHVVAYLRRADGGVALVVANLGAEPVGELALAGRRGALPAGRYGARTLLGDLQLPMLRVARDGRPQDWRVPVLAGRSAAVLELKRAE
jgi:glycosidase